MEWQLFFWLFVAHHIGDIALQQSWMAETKGKRWYIMMSHVAIWTGICCLPLAYFGLLEVWKPIFLFGVHYVTDRWKVNKPKDDAHWHLIYYDQGIHYLQLLIVSIF